MSSKPKSKLEFQDPLLRAVSIMAGEGRRIYIVVANNIQVPIGINADNGLLYRIPDALNIKQVAGRASMQIGHAKALVHLKMAQRALEPCLQGKFTVPKGDKDYLNTLWETLTMPLTSISLSAKDNLELYHLYRLLEQRLDGRVYRFYDENEAVYGKDKQGVNVNHKVLTAIATEPVTAVQVGGILDYLALWKPEN